MLGLNFHAVEFPLLAKPPTGIQQGKDYSSGANPIPLGRLTSVDIMSRLGISIILFLDIIPDRYYLLSESLL